MCVEGGVVTIGSRHLMATWVRRQHAGPLNEKKERLSAPLLRTHLHAVGSHYGRRAAPELQDSVEPPFLRTGPAPPIRPTRLNGSSAHQSAGCLILPVSRFSGPSSFSSSSPPPASIFHGTIVGLPAREAGYQECLKLRFCSVIQLLYSVRA